MNIVISNDLSSGVDSVQEWLQFNAIPYQQRAFWHKKLNMFHLWSDLEHSVIVLNQNVFETFFDVDSAVPNLTDFCKKGNQIWVLGMDFGVRWLTKKLQEIAHIIDDVIPYHSVVFVLDAATATDCYLLSLKNIKIQSMPANFFMKNMPRLQGNMLQPRTPNFDYLLTMTKKSSKPERNLIWEQLHSRPGLAERGCISYTDKYTSLWVGQKSAVHTWNDGHASPDLYTNCFLELVPETCYRDLYFFTEKTYKPIMTKTPFLMVSTAGYLSYLHSLGFKTFGHLIDESYDQRSNIIDRVDSVIDVLEYVITNGAEQFYLECQPVLDHNFSRLCEIAGGWNVQFDSMMWQLLTEFNQVSS